jgi:hypothetical protein
MSASAMELQKVLFETRAADKAVRPRGSRDETQHQQSHEKPSDSTRCSVTHTGREKLPEGPGSFFLLPMVSISLFLHDQCVLHHFLCFSPFINLGMRFFLKGGLEHHALQNP